MEGASQSFISKAFLSPKAFMTLLLRFPLNSVSTSMKALPLYVTSDCRPLLNRDALYSLM